MNNFPETKWVSEDPDIWFIIESGQEDEVYGEICPGEIKINGEAKKITVSFRGFSTAVHFYELDSDGNAIDYLRGTCKFYSDKLVVKVTKKSDELYGGKYKTITFVKEDLPYVIPAANWVSEIPYIKIEQKYPDYFKEMYGVMNVNGEELKIGALFDYGNNIGMGFVLCVMNGEGKGMKAVAKGNYVFTENAIFVIIDKETDTIFNGQFDSITFSKEPVEIQEE